MSTTHMVEKVFSIASLCRPALVSQGLHIISSSRFHYGWNNEFAFVGKPQCVDYWQHFARHVLQLITLYEKQTQMHRFNRTFDGLLFIVTLHGRPGNTFMGLYFSAPSRRLGLFAAKRWDMLHPLHLKKKKTRECTSRWQHSFQI